MDGRISASRAVDIRRQLIDWYGSKKGAANTVASDPQHDPSTVLLLHALGWVSELTAVSADMGDLIELAAPTIPLDVITTADIPHEFGMVILDKPLIYDIGDETVRYNNVLMWTVIEEKAVRVFSLQHIATSGDPFWQSGWEGAGKYHPPTFQVNLTLQFKLDTDLSDIEGTWRTEDNEALLLPADQAVRFLRAFWAISAEPYVVATKTDPDRAARKRAERAQVPADAVRVITLRRKAAEATREVMDAQTRHLHHRFIVSGHWRRQACGPNRSERKLRWIAPFVKGPDDAEWLTGAKLYRLER